MHDLIQKNQPVEAYTLGLAHADELGDPQFDLYFGIAAVGAGHAGEGVLALERYVQQFPNDLSARAQLAVGYFALGDDLRSQQEFEYLQKQNPPPEVASIIDHYLTAIRSRQSEYKTTWSGFVEAGLGFDNNTNSGAGSSTVNVPVLGAVTLEPGGVKIPSVYQEIAAGGQVSTPIAPGITAFGAANIDDKLNDADDAHGYDILTFGLRGGATYVDQDNLYRLTGGLSELQLDGTDYLEVASIAGDVSHQIDPFQSIVGSLSVAGLRYPTQTIRNSTIYTGDLSYRRVLVAPWNPVLSGGLTLGYEDNPRAGNLARHIYGVHVETSVVPLPQWLLLAGLAVQQSDYLDEEPLLVTTRHDTYGSLNLLAVYQYNRQLSLRIEALVSGNHSNLGLYAYDRNVISAKVRYEF